jgi:hypothetical protein
MLCLVVRLKLFRRIKFSFLYNKTVLTLKDLKKSAHPEITNVHMTLGYTSFRQPATSVNILSSSYLYCHYMFRPNWPSSDVQVVVMKETAALLMMFRFSSV